MLIHYSHGRAAFLGAIALAVCASGNAQAEAPRRPDVAPVMALGVAAAPPLGFLDFCARQASACLAPGETLPDLAEMRTAALQRFWSDAFAQRPTAPAAAADAPFDWSQVFKPAPARTSAAQVRLSRGGGMGRMSPTIQSVSTTAPQAADAAMAAADFGGAAVDTDAAAMMSVASAADAAVFAPRALAIAVGTLADSREEAEVTVSDPVETAPSVGKTFALDRAGWRLVNGVNRRINRAIRQTSDERLYGTGDFWAMPTSGRGDCEDFVLAKRAALIAEGVPAEALSIAIVVTRWGESHAVLLLASDRGEYVLDSLTPWVSRWDRVDYAWRERQRPGQPFDWVQAAI